MRVVMDDAGDVSAKLRKELGIVTLPVNIMFGTEQFLSGVTMNHQQFYEKVKTVGNHNFPKTSQPTPFQFEEAYRQLIAAGEREILTITVSEKLSGTYASAVAAAKELEGQATFHLIDSQSGSAAQGILVIEAARMAKAGVPAGEIVKRINHLRTQSFVYFLIDSLEYAVKGGRVSTLRSTVASLLNIKPVMTLKDGVIVESSKVRTYKKALDYIIGVMKNDVGSRPVKMAVMHGGSPTTGQALMEMAHREFNIKEDFFVDMSVAVAINLGPGALGLVGVIDD